MKTHTFAYRDDVADGVTFEWGIECRNVLQWRAGGAYQPVRRNRTHNISVPEVFKGIDTKLADRQ